MQVTLAFEGPKTDDLQAFLDSLAADGTSDVRAATDFLSDLMDSTWKITVPTESVSTFMFTTVNPQDGYTFGIYHNEQYVKLFASNMMPGAQTLLEILADGSVFVNHSDTELISLIPPSDFSWIPATADSTAIPLLTPMDLITCSHIKGLGK